MIYTLLILFHSIFRWLVIICLMYAVYRAYTGIKKNRSFVKADDLLRFYTVTIAHIQLTIGILLYTQSPVIKYFWNNLNEGIQNWDALFFALVHLFLMIFAVVLLTVGSAISKKKNSDREKFKAMFVWFTISFLIILIAIPWPFSPLSNRPYIRFL